MCSVLTWILYEDVLVKTLHDADNIQRDKFILVTYTDGQFLSFPVSLPLKSLSLYLYLSPYLPLSFLKFENTTVT